MPTQKPGATLTLHNSHSPPSPLTAALGEEEEEVEEEEERRERPLSRKPRCQHASDRPSQSFLSSCLPTYTSSATNKMTAPERLVVYWTSTLFWPRLSGSCRVNVGANVSEKSRGLRGSLVHTDRTTPGPKHLPFAASHKHMHACDARTKPNEKETRRRGEKRTTCRRSPTWCGGRRGRARPGPRPSRWRRSRPSGTWASPSLCGHMWAVWEGGVHALSCGVM
jgi:hypothetical protein